MKEDRHKRLHIVWFYLYETSQKGNTVEVESRSVVAKSQEPGADEWVGLTAIRPEGTVVSQVS